LYGHGSAMPSSAQALLVFVVAVVPGFLALSGYRAGRAVPQHPEGLTTTARVITLSVLIILVAWRLGGREVYLDAQAGTALSSNEGDTYNLAMALLIAPPLVGIAVGQFVDAVARRVSQAQTGGSHQLLRERPWLSIVGTQLAPEGPATWDRTWRKLRHTQPFVMVRVTTRGGREWVGLVADASRVALSPQPRDLYMQEVWLQADDEHYYPTEGGLGVFISGNEIESVEWVSGVGFISDDAP